MIPATGMPFLDWFLALLDNWGYGVVFGFSLFENLFVVGSFTPGETVVVAASLLAARDLLFISGVWAAALIGTLVGSNISYFMGRRAGLSGVTDFAMRMSATRMGRLLRIHPEGVDEVYEHFHTDGAKTVLLARFAIGAKNFVPAVAGATHMPVLWFELYTLLGTLIYATGMCAIGWFLGGNIDFALVVIRRLGYAGLAVFVVFVVSAVWARRRIKARRAAKVAAEKDLRASGQGGDNGHS